jgi:tRNA(Ile)-lysidine synthase
MPTAATRPDTGLLATLSASLGALPAKASLCVAFSGGGDSTALLEACRLVAGERRLRAVHINHGRAQAADQWESHCRAFCAARNIGFMARRVVVEVAGQGFEAAARAARYSALAAGLGAGEYLLTAHHADDQLETVLLHLARGSGVTGLSGIAPLQTFGPGFLWRPLLGLPGGVLRAFVASEGLVTVHDPSNADTRLDRNFLRARVVPVFRERWPHLARAVGRSARLAGEAEGLLAERAAEDATIVAAGTHLSLPAMQALGEARQRNLLRHLARRAGLPAPPETALRSGLAALLGPAGRSPAVRWPGAWLRRYRDRLYLFADPGPLPRPSAPVPWAGDAGLDLGPWRGRLALAPATGAGLDPALARAGLEVAFRSGAVALKPAGDRHHRSLKYLCQSAGIVPWMRPHLPLVYAAPAGSASGRLLAIGDRWIAHDAVAPAGAPGLAIAWTGHPPVA